MANAYRDRKRRPRPFEVSDFMFDFGRTRDANTPEQQLAAVRLWNRAFGGTEQGRA